MSGYADPCPFRLAYRSCDFSVQSQERFSADATLRVRTSHPSVSSDALVSASFEQIPAYPVQAALRGVNRPILLRNRGDADEDRSPHRSLECAPRQDLPHRDHDRGTYISAPLEKELQRENTRVVGYHASFWLESMEQSYGEKVARAS